MELQKIYKEVENRHENIRVGLSVTGHAEHVGNPLKRSDQLRLFDERGRIFVVVRVAEENFGILTFFFHAFS